MGCFQCHIVDGKERCDCGYITHKHFEVPRKVYVVVSCPDYSVEIIELITFSLSKAKKFRDKIHGKYMYGSRLSIYAVEDTPDEE